MICESGSRVTPLWGCVTLIGRFACIPNPSADERKWSKNTEKWDHTKHSTQTWQQHYKTHCCYYGLSDNAQEGLNMACISVYRNLGFLPELLEYCLVKGTWYHIPHRSTLRIINTIQASTFLLTWEQGHKMMNIYEGLTLMLMNAVWRHSNMCILSWN